MMRRILLIVFLGLHTVAAAEQYLLTESTYRVLSAAQEKMEAQQYTQAERDLQALLRDISSGSYDAAVVRQTLGYLYSETGDYARAASTFREALASEALPPDVNHNLRFNLAQLLIAADNYREGIAELERWMQNEASPSDNAYLLLATAYYRLPDYQKSIDTIRILINRTSQPKEEWYRLQLASHMELNQYRAATSLLETMVSRYPYQKNYWDQLAALYMQQEQQFRSLAVHSLTMRMDLGDANTLQRIIDMYRYLGIPYKAARMLEQAMADGVIARNFEQQKRLADSWLAARELGRAIEVLSSIATQDQTGETGFQLARLQINEERWTDALATLQQVEPMLESERLRGELLLLKGMAYFNLGDYLQARTQFSQAVAFERQRNQAGQWLRHVDGLLSEQQSAS
ncbi:tetratricopeptide repeat protein [Methylophaga lonarensis]|uniref:tetratricopeptide repeat protein n=1 Tax=Methylophaga lonarensis TaxID=999151 RepID=UPI003D28ADFE